MLLKLEDARDNIIIIIVFAKREQKGNVMLCTEKAFKTFFNN